MKITHVVLVALVGLTCLADHSTADVVHFQFTGTVTSAFDNDPNNNQNNVFGEDVGVGDQVTGTFTFDTDLAPTADLGNAAEYSPKSPSFFSVQMGSTTYSSDGIFYAAVADNFGATDPQDVFVMIDGEDDDPATNVGDTILVDGDVLTGFMSWRIFDSSAGSLSSTMLPSLSNIENFDFTEGEVSGTDTNGIFGLARYSIDSVSVVAIPEPSSSVLLLAGLASVIAMRRSKKQQS